MARRDVWRRMGIEANDEADVKCGASFSLASLLDGSRAPSLPLHTGHISRRRSEIMVFSNLQWAFFFGFACAILIRAFIDRMDFGHCADVKGREYDKN